MEELTIEEKLKYPFPLKDVEWRVQQTGLSIDKPWALVLAYIDARAVQDRLDRVFGVEGWQDDYEQWSGGTVCKLSVKIKDSWVTKTDGSPETEIEAFKGGLSKALVRTASKFGIGRYLYKLPVEFATCQFNKPSAKEGWNSAKLPKKYDYKTFYWQTPIHMPDWALPKKRG